MTWSPLHNAERIVIDREPTIELIGLCLARRRL